jgi:extradiol dioxygenase family protein
VRYGDQKINFHVGGPAFLPAARHVCMGSADFCLIAAGDILSLFEELKAKNAPFEEPAGIVRRTGALGPIDSIYLRDPDGNLVEISVYTTIPL